MADILKLILLNLIFLIPGMYNIYWQMTLSKVCCDFIRTDLPQIYCDLIEYTRFLQRPAKSCRRSLYLTCLVSPYTIYKEYSEDLRDRVLAIWQTYNNIRVKKRMRIVILDKREYEILWNDVNKDRSKGREDVVTKFKKDNPSFAETTYWAQKESLKVKDITDYAIFNEKIIVEYPDIKKREGRLHLIAEESILQERLKLFEMAPKLETLFFNSFDEIIKHIGLST